MKTARTTFFTRDKNFYKDVYKRQLLGEIERYIEGKLSPIEEVQCCGLGGCAPVKEPELAKNMGAALKNSGGQKIYSLSLIHI